MCVFVCTCVYLCVCVPVCVCVCAYLCVPVCDVTDEVEHEGGQVGGGQQLQVCVQTEPAHQRQQQQQLSIRVHPRTQRRTHTQVLQENQQREGA